MARLNHPAVLPDSTETLRRKWLRQNKELARNSNTQAVRVRELEAELSEVVTENLELRGRIIELENAARKNDAQRVADYATSIKEKLQAQLTEWGALVASIGLEPPAEQPNSASPSETASSSIKMTAPPRRSPSQRRLRDIANDVEKLGCISEHRYCPRKSMSPEEIQALQSEAESEDMSELPQHVVADQVPSKTDTPLRESRARNYTTGLDSSPLVVSSPNLDNLCIAPVSQQKKKNITPMMRESRILADWAPNTPIAQPIKAGSKRKYARSEFEPMTTREGTMEDKTMLQPAPAPAPAPARKTWKRRRWVDPGKNSAEMITNRLRVESNERVNELLDEAAMIEREKRENPSLRDDNEMWNPAELATIQLQEETNVRLEELMKQSATIEGAKRAHQRIKEREIEAARRPLADMSTNNDVLSPRKMMQKTDRVANSSSLVNKNTKPDLSKSKLAIRIQALRRKAEERELQALSQQTPALSCSLQDLRGGTRGEALTVERLSETREAHQVETLSSETSRSTRRNRPAISYAEPNLRDKLRRPRNETFDAVSGEEKNRRFSQSYQTGKYQLIHRDMAEYDGGDLWKEVPATHGRVSDYPAGAHDNALSDGTRCYQDLPSTVDTDGRTRASHYRRSSNGKDVYEFASSPPSVEETVEGIAAIRTSSRLRVASCRLSEAVESEVEHEQTGYRRRNTMM